MHPQKQANKRKAFSFKIPNLVAFITGGYGTNVPSQAFSPDGKCSVSLKERSFEYNYFYPAITFFNGTIIYCSLGYNDKKCGKYDPLSASWSELPNMTYNHYALSGKIKQFIVFSYFFENLLKKNMERITLKRCTKRSDFN